MFWRTRCGVPWRDMPPSFGPWKTVYNRHRRWSGDGTLAGILDELRRDADVAEGLERHIGAERRLRPRTRGWPKAGRGASRGRGRVPRPPRPPGGPAPRPPADIPAEVVATT